MRLVDSAVYENAVRGSGIHFPCFYLQVVDLKFNTTVGLIHENDIVLLVKVLTALMLLDSKTKSVKVTGRYTANNQQPNKKIWEKVNILRNKQTNKQTKEKF